MDAPASNANSPVTTETRLVADPRLLRVWLDGWCKARGLPFATPAYDGWHVAVGLPDQQTRLVFASASAGFSQASQAIREPHVFLKACTVTRNDGAPPRARLADAITGLPDGNTGLRSCLRRSAEPTSGSARIRADILRDGAVAAYGTVVMVDGFAIFDRIRTHEDYRRQGLGRMIMMHLAAAAHAAGARHGLLVATAEGRALYETTGWRLHSPYSTAVRPPDAA